MIPNFVLNPVFYDVGWDKQPEQKDRGGLEFSQVQSRNDWIVKVKFNQGGLFFVNSFPYKAPKKTVHKVSSH